MPIPKTKQELLDMSQNNYEKLIQYIDSLPSEKRLFEFPPDHLNRNIRDVLGHLHHWHLLFLKWYEEGMAGEKPHLPAKGYTWKTTGDLNRFIQKKYQKVKYTRIRKMLEDSHWKVCQIIESHTDTELFEKKKYKWTGSTSLGVYLRGATTSHYDWAYKLIRRCLK
jgi:hypothetical protein